MFGKKVRVVQFNSNKTIINSGSGSVQLGVPSSQQIMQFRVRDVPGAGNCLFEAVGRSINISAKDLREYAVNWMMAENQRLHGEDLKVWIQNGADIPLSPQDPIGSYVAHMKRQGSWGGGIELAVLSTLLNRPILVYTCDADPNQAKRVAEFLPDVKDVENLPAVCILYVGRAHYMQLIPENLENK